jgi:bifunctional non-homologous end joining protein LigD
VKDEAATTWVKPSLVAEVKFAEWTSKGELRQPVYLGLRSDKPAKDVVRERERPRK